MRPPIWINLQDALAIHDKLLAIDGGLCGTRDLGLLESALARPVNYFAYEHPSLFQLAAAYGFGIAKNHPFNDGNKRTAFVVAATFLRVNKQKLKASQVEAVVIVQGLAAGNVSEKQFAQWLEANCH